MRDERAVELDIIEKWLSINGPTPVERLAVRANCSASTITNCRRGWAPKKPDTRQKIAKALGVSEDELFPLARAQSA